MDYQYGQNNDNGYQGNNDNGYQGNNDYIYYYNNSYGMNQPDPREKKREKKGGGVIVAAIILSLIMGTTGGALGSALMLQMYGGLGSQKVQEVQETAVPAPVTETETGTALPQTLQPPAAQMAQTVDMGLSVKQISEMCLPSVVAITNKGEAEIRSYWGTFIQETEGSGSGVIVGKTDSELLIVTNYHVVSGSKELSVLFSYQEQAADSSESQIVRGEIKDYSSGKDLAVVAVPLESLSQETMNNIKVATIGDSNELALGEQVVAIGNALGYGQSVTAGYVSALGRSMTTQDNTGNENKYIQTDAAINPGNSGGAMFNMNGELVGINSAKVADTTVEGIGYAIPISDIREDMEGMMQRETRATLAETERGYLGISVSNVTSEINKVYDIPIGAYISSVTEGSPAEIAGLQRGMVVTQVDGRNVRTREELVSYLSGYRAGETVTLTVEVNNGNGYEAKQISVTLYSAAEAGVNQDGQGSAPAQDNAQESNGGYAPNENPFGNFFPFSLPNW